MAVSFWLPKVVVILTFCGISRASDDLLNRIRLSNSNEPEVTDFLQTVLKHQNDFKWIQSTAGKHSGNENMLPLKGLPMKSKRSFYSSRAGYPYYRMYGYRMSPYSSLDRPINDVYPYDEDNESRFNPHEAERAYGDAMYTSRYNNPVDDDKLRYGDFFLNEEPDANVVNSAYNEELGERNKREVEKYDVSEEKHQVPEDGENINGDIERLFNEKMILHNRLGNRHQKDHKLLKESYQRQDLSGNVEDLNGNKIQVVPNGEIGYMYAPGSKYEYKSDDHKRCIENNDEHEIFGEIMNSNKINASVETPLGEFYYSGPHDILGISQDQQLEAHEKQNSTSYTACSKFRKNVRQKRSIHFDDLLSPSKHSKKQDKSIKIKIFDDGRLVKNIKKGEANSIVLTIKKDKSNIFRTIEEATPLYANSGKKYRDFNSGQKYHDFIPLTLYSGVFPPLQDDTLQKIDTIIQHDQASLKLNTQFPPGIKVRKESLPLSDIFCDRMLLPINGEDTINNAYTTVKRKSNKIHTDRMSQVMQENIFPGENKHSPETKAKMKSSYERVGEMGTRYNKNIDLSQLLNREGSYEYNILPYNNFRINTPDVKRITRNRDVAPLRKNNVVPKKPCDADTQKTFPESTTVFGNVQNRLEDQSEPTSAAEQRELGKINNSFSRPMEVLTTEKMLIIPFKKNSDAQFDYVDDEPLPNNKFYVKESRDMIHTGGVKIKKSQESFIAHQDVPVFIYNSLKAASDVMDKLKEDLSKTAKGEITRSNVNFEGGRPYDSFRDEAIDEDDNGKMYDAEYDVKSVPDDNIEMSTPVASTAAPSTVKKKNSRHSSVIKLEDDVEMPNLEDSHDRNGEFEIYSYKMRRLKSLEDNSRTNLMGNLLKNKRSLTDLFGMSNDEDYSEDKIDYYDLDFKNKRSDIGPDLSYKAKKPRRKIVGKKNNQKPNNKVVTHDNSKRNGAHYLKSKGTTASLTKKTKVKKGASLELPEVMESSQTKLNLFTDNVDVIKKRDSPLKYIQNDDSNQAELDDNDDSESQSNEENSTAENCEVPTDSITANGNELDIIESTQAIHLHLTHPPATIVNVLTTETSTSRGEYDESDDPNAKIEEHRSNFDRYRNDQYSNKQASNVDKNEDIIGKIFKLVKLYKENEMRNYVPQFKTASLNKIKQRGNRFYDAADDLADVSFSHHLHKDPKLHPKKTGGMACKIPPGSDLHSQRYHTKHSENDSQFDLPKATREGFMETDTVLTKKEKITENQSDRDADEFSYWQDMIERKDNPMRFTPDRLEHFKNIVETPISKREISDKNFYDNIKPSNLQESNKIRKYIDSLKEEYTNALRRDRRSLKGKNDGSFKNLLSQFQMNDGRWLNGEDDMGLRHAASRVNVPVNFNDNTPLRRYKNYLYNPFYYDTLSRIRQRTSNELNNNISLHSPENTAFGPLKSTDVTKFNEVIKVRESNITNVGESSTVSLGLVSTGSTSSIASTTNKKSDVKTSSVSSILSANSTLGIQRSDLQKSCLAIDEKALKDVKMQRKGKNHPDRFRKPYKNKKSHSGKTKCDNLEHSHMRDNEKEIHNKRMKEKRVETEREQKLKEKNRNKMACEKESNQRKDHEHFKNVLNGHIILDIIDKFHDRLKQNEKLLSRFGHALGKKCVIDQVKQIDIFREEQSKKDIKHAQLMLHQVIVMMNKIVADQVHRRTCVVLPPSVKEFLKKITTVTHANTKSLQVAEGYPLPPIGDRNKQPMSINPDDRQSDFLFNNPSSPDDSFESGKYRQEKIKKKINLIRKLLNKYDHMSESCQIKVQPVKDYLLQHMHMLEKVSIENKSDDDICPVSSQYFNRCQNQTTASQCDLKAPLLSTTINLTERSAVITINRETTTTGTTTPIINHSAAVHAGRSPTKTMYQDSYMRSLHNKRHHPRFESSHAKALSEKYRKLEETADSFRRKRQSVERLAHLFGRHKRLPETSVNTKKSQKTLKEIGFESPVVYSLDN